MPGKRFFASLRMTEYTKGVRFQRSFDAAVQRPIPNVILSERSE